MSPCQASDCDDAHPISDFRAVASYTRSIHDHRTGRKCTLCGGALYDTIINFEESLPVEDLRRARHHAAKADLCLVLGSSLLVSPANALPEAVGRKKNANLVICNLQATPCDEMCSLRVFSEADALMTKLMQKLELPIPRFILRRRLVIRVESDLDKRHQVTVLGVDTDGTPISFLQSVKLLEYRRQVREEPFALGFRGDLVAGTRLTVELQFMGHYNEPNLTVPHDYQGANSEEAVYGLAFDPQTGIWTMSAESVSTVQNSSI